MVQNHGSKFGLEKNIEVAVLEEETDEWQTVKT